MTESIAPSRTDPSPIEPTSRSVTLTTAGWGAVAVSCVLLAMAWFVGGAAVPAAALSLALLVAAPVIVRQQTKDVRILPCPPVSAFAGERFTLEIPLVNGSRRFVARDLVLRHQGRRWRTAGYCGSVLPGGLTIVESEHPALPRGRVRSHRLQVTSSFPFGLARCWLVFQVPVNVLVLPRLGALRRVNRLTAGSHGLPVSGRSERGDEQEFYGLRNWREGETQRRVAWKLSARRGRPLVREFRGQARPPVHVVLSTGVHGVRRAGGQRSFDRAVSVAATVVEHFLRHSHPVRLTLLGAEARPVDCGRGRRGLLPTLAVLAEVSAESQRRVLAPEEYAARVARRGESALIVRAGGPSAGRAAVQPVGRRSVVIDVDGAGLSDVYTATRVLGHQALLGIAR